MGDGFIRWYRESGRTSIFRYQVEHFGRFGVTVKNPGTGVVAAVNVDGDDVPVTCDELEWLLSLRLSPVTMNWWMSSDSNLAAEYSYESLGCEIQTFWLDGLSREEVDTVTRAVENTASLSPTSTRALVFDFEEATEPDDWDSLALYGEKAIPALVDSLLLGSDLANSLILNSTGISGEEMESGLVRISGI
ncbi:hypothetical protein [Streptomyces sp. NPDC059262]|uniref:hypothetical protein n=1 Tax=Streptomyces sp. NPDC059262 TaxID=3346797 RepID=UPI0036CF6E7D